MHAQKISKRCGKNGGGSDSKIKKNLSNSEVEVLLQEVGDKRHIFSSVSSGYKAVNKTNTWNAITHAVNAVSGEGHRTDEVFSTSGERFN